MNIYATELKLVINGTQILDRVSFSIPDGSFACIMGPNGAGKSSILRIISKDILSYSGSVTDINHNQMTYLPQDILPPPFLRTIEVVKIGFYGQSMTSQDQQTQSQKLLETCGIQHLENHLFTDISAGEKQRTWLAFALAQSKDLILMDEPLAAIDVSTRKNFSTLLRTIVDGGRTLILVDHDMDLASKICDHLIVLQSGKKVFEGAPTDFRKPTE